MAKHKYIETPEKLWELFLEYKAEVKGNPRKKVEYVGKDGDRVETPIERPLIIEGFKTYCAYKVGTIDHYWKNTDNAYEEYCPIITRIKQEIRQDQFEGGLLNQYNANLTARLNGVTDKKEVEHKGTPPLFGPEVNKD